jgi:hypothetical protein
MDDVHKTSNVRRSARDGVIQGLKLLAEKRGVGGVKSRPDHEQLQKLFVSLAGKGDDEALGSLAVTWNENGGGKIDCGVPASSVDGPESAVNQAEPHEQGTLPSHRSLPPGTEKKKFRLCSKAFMVTYNAAAFVASLEFWNIFLLWVQEICSTFSQDSVHKPFVWNCVFIFYWLQETNSSQICRQLGPPEQQ